MLKVYLAAPFFNPEQVQSVKALEELLESIQGVQVFSPMRDGIFVKPDDTLENREAAYKSNVESIDNSDFLVAIIDNKDTGTTFEIGYAAAKKVPVIAYAFNDVTKLNLMLANGFTAFVQNDLQLLKNILREFQGLLAEMTKYADENKASQDSLSGDINKFRTETQIRERDLTKRSKEINEKVQTDVDSFSNRFNTLAKYWQDKTIFKQEIE